MKQFLKILIMILLISITNVYAKDTVYSLNKYAEEKWSYMEHSYSKDNKRDGMIVAGEVLKETITENDNTYKNYQVIIAKYNNNGHLNWTYSYGNTSEDRVDSLTYTYDEEKNVKGYLIAVPKTYDALTEAMGDNNTLLLELDLEGKYVKEFDIPEGIIEKIIPISDGYIAIMNTHTGSSLVHYNSNLETIWKRDFQEVEAKDLIVLTEDNKEVGYVIIRGNQVVLLNENGENEKVIEELENKPYVSLENTKTGYRIYGITKDVKLKKGNASYFIQEYTREEQLWEVIGDIPVHPDKKVFLKNNLLLYQNKADSSYEVIELDQDGLVVKKVKKIKNDYYQIENFMSKKNTLYFIGQIKCPEDDNCEYNQNSLYIISDEDKVIEVEDKESTNIIIVIGTVLIVLVGLIYIKKKKGLE